MDREQLADFLRRRREALQPADVGLDPGTRRRTPGLRREEVALLAHMSADYYGRLEQQRGPQPSEQMVGAIARALRLDIDERDHLFRLTGHPAPLRAFRTEHVAPALMRVLDRLDTPAQVVSDLGQTLAQNALAIALLGDQRDRPGLDRYMVHRFFTDPEQRALWPTDTHAHHGAVFTAGLRRALDADADGQAARIRDALLAASPAFATEWERHAVRQRQTEERKRILHPAIGELTLHCQTLVAENQLQSLLVYTATPGSEDAEKLKLVAMVGREPAVAGR